MARKAAQKLAVKAPPLDGCSIATSGRFNGTTQGALQTRVTSLGAAIASSVTADTTHLIATEKDFESNSTKVKAAAAHNVPVVTIDWLEECEARGKQMPQTRGEGLQANFSADAKVDETQYLLSSAAAAAPAPPQNGSKKRAASSPPPAQDSKKPKIKENAKVGDGQVSSRGTSKAFSLH
jgi:poly [ADP-ribose] polymerase